MGLGLREREEGSPPRRSRGMLGGTGLVSGEAEGTHHGTEGWHGAGGAVLECGGVKGEGVTVFEP